MKFTHKSVQPLFSVVFLSKVTLSGLTKETNKKYYVNTNVMYCYSSIMGLVLKIKPSYSVNKRILSRCVSQGKRLTLDDKRLNIVVFFV